MIAYYMRGSEWPLFAGDIMESHPGWNIGDSLPEGWSAVEESEPPSNVDLETHYCVWDTPVGGVTGWKVVAYTKEQLARRAAQDDLRAISELSGVDVDRIVYLAKTYESS